MASRRSRIKDIANIPQRRKTAVGVVQEKQKEEIAKNDDKDKAKEGEHSEKGVERKHEADTISIKLDTDQTNENKKEGINGEDSVIEEEEIATYVRKPEEIVAINDIKNEIGKLKKIPNTQIDDGVESKFNISSSVIEDKKAVTVKLQQNENVTAEQQEKAGNDVKAEPNLNFKTLTAVTSEVSPRVGQIKPIFKGNFIKPIISNSVLQRRNRLKVEDDTRTSESEGESSVTSKREIDEKSALLEQLPVKEINDITYPPAPPSPSKINRGRIKVVPRFGQRRQSFSASESEDDNKKSSRIRNDSVSIAVLMCVENIKSTVFRSALQPLRWWSNLTHWSVHILPKKMLQMLYSVNLEEQNNPENWQRQGGTFYRSLVHQSLIDKS